MAVNSFAGWSLFVWLKKQAKLFAFLVWQKEALKLLIAAIFVAITGYLKLVADPTLNVLLMTAAGIFGKMAADALDYFLKEDPK